MLLAGIFASSVFFSMPSSGQGAKTAPLVQTAAVKVPDRAADVSSAAAAGWHAREGAFYKRNWGIDIVDVRRVASGEMLAFRYVVLDPNKAKILNDKMNPASLVDEATGTKLSVPQMEKVGALRTTVTPVSGRMYWIIFANTGRVVKDGSRVDVNIGAFHAQGITVISK